MSIDTRERAAALKQIFGENLKTLASQSRSVAALCRDLGINRTQFNRYLSGESYPRPEVLEKICKFFDTDARILLEPLADLPPAAPPRLDHPELRDFPDTGRDPIEPEDMPLGFYRAFFPNLSNPQTVVAMAYRMYRRSGQRFIRGFAPQGVLPKAGQGHRQREIRGTLFRQNGGIAIIYAKRAVGSSSYALINPHDLQDGRAAWAGSAMMLSGQDPGHAACLPILFIYAGTAFRDGLSAVRGAGHMPRSALPAHLDALLRA